MATYYIETDLGKKYIKDIDFAQGTLTFTTNKDEAYDGRNGYYAIPTRDMIRRNFSEDYPEVKKLECSAAW